MRRLAFANDWILAVLGQLEVASWAESPMDFAEALLVATWLEDGGHLFQLSNSQVAFFISLSPMCDVLRVLLAALSGNALQNASCEILENLMRMATAGSREGTLRTLLPKIASDEADNEWGGIPVAFTKGAVCPASAACLGALIEWGVHVSTLRRRINSWDIKAGLQLKAIASKTPLLNTLERVCAREKAHQSLQEVAASYRLLPVATT